MNASPTDSGPRIVVIGARGQLGTALCEALPDAVPLTHDQIEITNPDSIARALAEANADVVINTAAYNLVDKAEAEPQAAQAGNTLGPSLLAQWCAAHNRVLVQISTDHVFGQTVSEPRPWTVEDLPQPASEYGRSKLAGEQAVLAASPKHLVVRTCGLYGRAASTAKRNFVETMLKFGRERGEVRVVADQVCTPTATRDLAEYLIALIDVGAQGLIHATNAGETSWANFATEIFRQGGIDARVIPISTQEFGAAAPRPPYSVLDTSSLTAATGIEPRPWQTALAEYLRT